MEILDKIIVCETDKGNYAARPLNWAGYWDKDGKIKECGLNHIAVFHYKEDAEWYAETKIAEEQGLIPKFHLGDEFWTIHWNGVRKEKIVMLQQKKDGTWKYRFPTTADYEENEFGKYFFNTKEEAEKALKQMGE